MHTTHTQANTSMDSNETERSLNTVTISTTVGQSMTQAGPAIGERSQQGTVFTLQGEHKGTLHISTPACQGANSIYTGM